MEIYILKSSACLAFFMLFYKLLLEKESFHTFKRFYLLAALFLAITIPLITFVTYVEASLKMPLDISEIATPPYVPEYMFENSTNYWTIFLWSLYLLGVIVFAFRFGKNLNNIAKRIKQNIKLKKQSVYHVLLNDLVPPHTFLNYIFFNKVRYNAREIPMEVLLHEETHAKEKHALDILFIELLQVVFWFNPLFYFIKKDIKLNHEFLADKAVLNNGIDSKNYQQLLLAFSSPDSYRDASVPQLTNAINYSSIKKRFTVMKTHTSKSAIWVRSLILLPLLAILIYSFSSKKVIEVESKKPHSNTIVNSSSKNELVIMVQVNSVSINARTTSIESFKKDLNNATKNWTESDFKSVIPILKIASCTEEYLKDLNKEFRQTDYFLKSSQSIKIINSEQKGAPKEQLAEYNKLGKKNISQTNPLPKIYGRICDACEISLTKEDIGNLKIETSTDEPIASYNIKFSGKPTVNVIGNKLNGKAISYLNNSKNGDYIQLFYIKTSTSKINSHVVIKLIDKSEIPPPPPPPVPANTSPEIKEQYKKAHESYNKKYSVKDGKVLKNPPPPPPPVPANATPEQKAKYKKVSEAYYKKYNVKDGKVSLIAPPPPPPPMSPLDHVIFMAKKNATFYYEGKEITSDKAIEILKSNKEMNISSKGSSSKNPKVYLSKEPIEIND